jgi:hypothetical protein
MKQRREGARYTKVQNKATIQTTTNVQGAWASFISSVVDKRDDVDEEEQGQKKVYSVF